MQVRTGLGASVGIGLLFLLTAAASPADQRKGYLAHGEFNVTTILEPAPRSGDPRYDTDRKIFKATRALRGSARWQMATTDAEYSVPGLMRDYSCAVGIQLTPETAPKLAAVVKRAAADTGAQSSHAKDIYQRERPFTIDHGAICQPASELFDTKRSRMSYDYPSGHTTYGWTWAIIVASIAPDRAQQILARGRAYGDSRFICGAHNESAVEAGMLSASATMTVIATKPEYQADLEAARTELAHLRAGGVPAAQGCEVENALIAQRVMPRLPAQR